MAKKVPYDTSGNLDIRPNKERAKIAELLIWSVMLVDVISIWSSYLQYDLLVQLNNDTWIPDRVLDSNDIREQSIALIYVVVYIVSIVVFIRWFRRAYYNLGRRTECAHSEGWAAGNWFVPIISLFRPYQIMKEMWMKTTRLTLSKTQEKVQKDSVENIGIWWFLWILSNYVAKYATKRAFKAETIENFINSTIMDMATSALGIPLAIFTVLVIRAYAEKEEKLLALEMKRTIPSTTST